MLQSSYFSIYPRGMQVHNGYGEQTQIYSLFCFVEQTITGTIYADILEMFLVPHLLANAIPHTVLFQQDGAPSHFILCVQDYLNMSVFPSRLLGRGSQRIWPERSPDLTP